MLRPLALAALSALAACGPLDAATEGHDAGSPDAASHDAGPATPDAGVDPALDSDGDGLPDVFELAANVPSVLDPTRADTDGNGIDDGDEDPDGDGLTNLEEWALARLPSSPSGCRPSPVRKTIALELDSMSNRAPSNDVLEVVRAAYAALPIAGLDGSTGVELCVHRDEEDIAAEVFDGDPNRRSDVLAAHGPRFTDRDAPAIPYGKLVHAMIVTARTDLPTRGGDTLSDASSVEHAGVLVYADALARIHPACGTATSRPITLDEALAATLVHELGHTLQLGHDTDVGGGVDHWNIMSVQGSCTDGQMRSHGLHNTDASLGNTEAVSAPRFSAAAAALMDFRHKVSADVSALDPASGREM